MNELIHRAVTRLNFWKGLLPPGKLNKRVGSLLRITDNSCSILILVLTLMVWDTFLCLNTDKILHNQLNSDDKANVKQSQFNIP